MTPAVWRVRLAAEDGWFTLLAPALLIGTTMLVIVLSDVVAYLHAASRAQAAADAAALAAVTVSDPRGRSPGNPRRAAEDVATPAGARIESCTCPPGAEHVRVAASVEVHAVAITRIGPRRVTADADARLIPP